MIGGMFYQTGGIYFLRILPTEINLSLYVHTMNYISMFSLHYLNVANPTGLSPLESQESTPEHNSQYVGTKHNFR